MSYSTYYLGQSHRQETAKIQRHVLIGLTGCKVIEVVGGQPGHSPAPPTPKMQNTGLHGSTGAQVPGQQQSIPAEHIKPSVRSSAPNGFSEAHLPAGGQFNDSFPQAIADISRSPPQTHQLPVAAHTVYPQHSHSLSLLLPSNVVDQPEFSGGVQKSRLHPPNASSGQLCSSTGRPGLTLQAAQALFDYEFGHFVRSVRSATAGVPQADAMLDAVNLYIPPTSNDYKEASALALRCKRDELVAHGVRLQEPQDRSSQVAISRPGYTSSVGLSSQALQAAPRHPKFSDWLVSRRDRSNSEPEALEWPPIEDIMQFMTKSVSPCGISIFSRDTVDLFTLRGQSDVDSQSTTLGTNILQIRRSTAQRESTSKVGTQRLRASGLEQFANSSASLKHTTSDSQSFRLQRGRKSDASQHPYKKLRIATADAKKIEDSLLMPPPQTRPRQSTHCAHKAELGQQLPTLPQTSLHTTSILYPNQDTSGNNAFLDALPSDHDSPDYPVAELPELHRNECPSQISYGHLKAYGSAGAIASYPPTFQASLQRTMQNMRMYEFRRSQSHDLVFVYGSLMISCLEHEIFSGRVSPFTINEVSQCMVAASVTGFARYRVRGSHEPIALETGKEKDVIHGMLILNLSAEHCRSLDRYTGRGYVRSPARFCVKLKTGHTNGIARIYCAPDDNFLDSSTGGNIMVNEPWTVEAFWENSPNCREWRKQSGRNHEVNSGVQFQKVQELNFSDQVGQDQPSARLEQGDIDQSLVYPQQHITCQMLNSLEPSASAQGWANFQQNGPAQTMSSVEEAGSVQNWDGHGQSGNDQTLNTLADAEWEPFPEIDLDPSSFDSYDFSMSSTH